MSCVDKQKIVVKLCKQFGHASVDRLTRLFKSAGTTDTDTLGLLQVVVEFFFICAQHRKPSCKPVVCLPLATGYSETVAVDLHELEHSVWYLHIIDEFM